MLSRALVRQIRLLQFRARRTVEELMGGEYHSVFKGTGLAFDEVREYQPGDDVRAIDWNVTARMGHPFIKRYVEERELTVFLVVDWSASQQFGTGLIRKHDVAVELTAVLAVSAISNNDKVGLIGFTGGIECFVPPRKGARHVLRLIRELLCLRPTARETSIQGALRFLNKVARRRAVVFLISDFHDAGYERLLKRVGRQHDLILVRISDPREQQILRTGLIELEDAETGRQILFDSRDPRLFGAFGEITRGRRDEFQRLARAAHADELEVGTDGGHLDALVRFFRRRERRLRKP